MMKVTERIDYILRTLSTEYIQQIYWLPLDLSSYVFNACEQSWIMMIVRGICMPKQSKTLRRLHILYHAYCTHQDNAI